MRGIFIDEYNEEVNITPDNVALAMYIFNVIADVTYTNPYEPIESQDINIDEPFATYYSLLATQ